MFLFWNDREVSFCGSKDTLGDRVHGKKTVIRKESRPTLFICSGPLLALHNAVDQNWQVFNHLLERARQPVILAPTPSSSRPISAVVARGIRGTLCIVRSAQFNANSPEDHAYLPIFYALDALSRWPALRNNVIQRVYENCVASDSSRIDDS